MILFSPLVHLRHPCSHSAKYSSDNIICYKSSTNNSIPISHIQPHMHSNNKNKGNSHLHFQGINATVNIIILSRQFKGHIPKSLEPKMRANLERSLLRVSKFNGGNMSIGLSCNDNTLQ